MMLLDDFQAEVGKWATETFPKSTVFSIAEHFDEEAQEFYSGVFRPGPMEETDEEAADVLLLLLHYCHVRGVSLADLAASKLEKNRARQWAVEPNERGYFKHVAR